MFTWKSLVRALSAAAVVMAGASAALAAYPERAITLVVPFSPGGTTDLAARLLAQQVQEKTGATIIVENRAGAGGMIGAKHVADAKPDGYTLLYGSDSLLLQPLLNKDAPVSTDSFIPLVRVRIAATYLGVSPTLQVNTLKELVALAKAKPGKITFATGGVGEINHMAGASFATAAGINLMHVPYKGEAPAATDAAAGHVGMVVGGAPGLSQYATAGQLKLLAQTGTERSLVLPDVPTMTELGYPDVVVINWNGVMAPKGTSDEAVQWLTRNVAEVATSETFLERGKPLGIEPGNMMQGEDFVEFLAQARKRYEKVLATSDIKVAD